VNFSPVNKTLQAVVALNCRPLNSKCHCRWSQASTQCGGDQRAAILSSYWSLPWRAASAAVGSCHWDCGGRRQPPIYPLGSTWQEPLELSTLTIPHIQLGYEPIDGASLNEAAIDHFPEWYPASPERSGGLLCGGTEFHQHTIDPREYTWAFWCFSMAFNGSHRQRSRRFSGPVGVYS